MKPLVSARRLRSIDKTLGLVLGLLPYEYAQWVVESPATWDYAVASSRFPAGGECYDVAHRPGVIGQVFRRKQPIFIPDVQAHPLYDVYDPSVEWELAVPLLDRGRLAAVLNLEGGGRVAVEDTLWRRLAEVISSQTNLELPEGAPEANEAWMVKTTRVEIPGTSDLAADSALRLGQAAAAGGLSVLVAGPLDLPPSSTYPTVEEALAAGVPPGGCFRGGGHRLDLLVETSGSTRAEDPPWWSLADGRYDFVLVASALSPGASG